MERKKFNGARLKEALLFREMRLTELAVKTGISKQSLSNYANESNIPPYDNVVKIAQGLDFPTDYFMVEDLCTTATDNIYFRSQTTATKTSQRAQEIKIEYVAKIYDVLTDYVELPELNLPKVSFEQNDNLAEVDFAKMIQQIEEAANQVRIQWKLGSGPIDNMQYILESNGIIVTSTRNAAAKIDAFSQKVRLGKGFDQGYVYVIALALGEKPIERLRFDMAHELGHILLHPWDESIEDLDKDAFNAREKQANMFASALLLPKSSFTRDVLPYATEINYYKHLKKKWRVSIQAMMYRARQLEIISGNQFSYMMRQVSQNGWRKKEPGDVPGELNSTIFQSTLDALFDGEYLDSHELRIRLAQSGIILSDNDLTDIMGLKAGTIEPESVPESKVLHLNIKSISE
ncbi:MAG: XRE family transcriptional regulator [Clostridia bacterium]|nr:XRE family transcriptional regulator [Clostridia bacterium]